MKHQAFFAGAARSLHTKARLSQTPVHGHQRWAGLYLEQLWSQPTLSTLSNKGSRLLFSTYLGGSDADDAFSVAIDPFGAAYLTGGTYSSDFPVTPGVVQPTLNGFLDAFITKIVLDEDGAPVVHRGQAVHSAAGMGRGVSSWWRSP